MGRRVAARLVTILDVPVAANERRGCWGKFEGWSSRIPRIEGQSRTRCCRGGSKRRPGSLLRKFRKGLDDVWRQAKILRGRDQAGSCEALDRLVDSLEACLSRPPERQQVVGIGDTPAEIAEQQREEVAKAVLGDATVGKDRGEVRTSVLLDDQVIEVLKAQPTQRVDRWPGEGSIDLVDRLIGEEAACLVPVDSLGDHVAHEGCGVEATDYDGIAALNAAPSSVLMAVSIPISAARRPRKIAGGRS
jgi:hypothetical protein